MDSFTMTIRGPQRLPALQIPHHDIAAVAHLLGEPKNRIQPIVTNSGQNSPPVRCECYGGDGGDTVRSDDSYFLPAFQIPDVESSRTNSASHTQGRRGGVPPGYGHAAV